MSALSQKHQYITDEKLLALFYSTHEQKWLGLLLERYTILLLGVCMKYLKNEENARDAVQQVYLKTLSAVPKTIIENFPAWIYRVAKNECYSRLRKKSNIVSVDNLVNMSDGENGLTIQEWTQEENKLERLKIGLEHLKPHQKTCIELFFFDEKSYKEIAESQGMNIKEVKSHIQNGKRNLKINLESAYSQTFKKGKL